MYQISTSHLFKLFVFITTDMPELSYIKLQRHSFAASELLVFPSGHYIRSYTIIFKMQAYND